jgi:hypothetical protein
MLIGDLDVRAVNRPESTVAKLAALLRRVGQARPDRSQVVDVLAASDTATGRVERRATLGADELEVLVALVIVTARLAVILEPLLTRVELTDRLLDLPDTLVVAVELLALIGLRVEPLTGVGRVDLLVTGDELRLLVAELLNRLDLRHCGVPP